jgi:hypothetical protein
MRKAWLLVIEEKKIIEKIFPCVSMGIVGSQGNRGNETSDNSADDDSE